MIPGGNVITRRGLYLEPLLTHISFKITLFHIRYIKNMMPLFHHPNWKIHAVLWRRRTRMIVKCVMRVCLAWSVRPPEFAWTSWHARPGSILAELTKALGREHFGTFVEVGHTLGGRKVALQQSHVLVGRCLAFDCHYWRRSWKLIHRATKHPKHWNLSIRR